MTETRVLLGALATPSPWVYQGNCVNSFHDDTGSCELAIFTDVSDFACAEERAIPVIQPDLISMPADVKGDIDYTFDVETGVLFAYSAKEDVHYFFTCSAAEPSLKDCAGVSPFALALIPSGSHEAIADDADLAQPAPRG